MPLRKKQKNCRRVTMNRLNNTNIEDIKKILHQIEVLNITIEDLDRLEEETGKLKINGKITYITLEDDEKKDILAKVRSRIEYDKSQLASALGEYVDNYAKRKVGKTE